MEINNFVFIVYAYLQEKRERGKERETDRHRRGQTKQESRKKQRV